MRAQAFGERAIRGADATVDLQGAEPEIEQHRGAVLRTQRFGVRADFAQHSAPAHRAGLLGQAERDALAPALRGDRFECDRPQVRMREQPDAAARRHDGTRHFAMLNVGRLIGVTRELRDRAERAEAPLRVRVGELSRDQIKGARHFASISGNGQ